MVNDVSKFTVNLDYSDSLLLDECVLGIRKQYGKRVNKSDLIRGMIQIVSEDPEFHKKIADKVLKTLS